MDKALSDMELRPESWSNKAAMAVNSGITAEGIED